MPAFSARLRPRVGAVFFSLATLAYGITAEACGGLFCSNSPVNQTAERIVFADHGDGRMTALIEIKYAGPAERFSWVVPVPGVPEVGLSSEQALDRIQQQSNPVFQLFSEFDTSCNLNFGLADAGALASDAGAFPASAPEVRVLAADSLGPFDYQVIRVDTKAKDPASVAIDWLELNNYDVSTLGEEILGDYLKSNMNLIAFRLNKTASAGAIRPVSLTYDSERAMIPIRPTAVAANENMGILVWVLGKHRAVPTNYRTLELNETLIDWFNPSSSYNDVVTAAANEAGGQGFVTESAGDTSPYLNRVLLPWEQDEWNELQAMVNQESRLDLLYRSAETLGSLDGYVDAVRESVPLRPGVSAEEFVECPSCYFETLRRKAEQNSTDAAIPEDSGIVFPNNSEDEIAELNAAKFIKSLDRLVVAPLIASQKLFDSADYVTRMYTTMSPDEMDKDPVFGFNKELPEVDPLHQATRKVSCKGDDEIWEVDFDGTVVRGVGRNWPIKPGSLPANKRILQLSTSGPGKVIEDNDSMIDDTVKQTPASIAVAKNDKKSKTDSKRPSPSDPSPSKSRAREEADAGDTGIDNKTVQNQSPSGGGCSAAPKPHPTGSLTAWMLLGLGLLGSRARRRNPLPRRA